MSRLASLLVLTACVALSGCAGYRAYEEGRRMVIEGDGVGGVQKLEEAVKASPKNTTYRQTYEQEKALVVGRLASEGDMFRFSGELDRAEASYRQAEKLDTNNPRVRAGLVEIAARRQERLVVAEQRAKVEAGDTETAEPVLRKILEVNPGQREARELMNRIADKKAQSQAAAVVSALKSPYTKPITLEFRDAALKSVFEVISRTAGINFVFDRDVRADTKINIVVRNSSLDDVIKLILLTNQLDRKLLNENSVLIYPNTPAKQKEYRELVVRSFYLANADVKQAVNLVKGMVKSQDVFIDEKLNLMVVKDTPEAMNVVDRLMRSLDLAEPEVMLELEVLEVSRTKLQTLGVQVPSSISFGDPAVSVGDTNAGTAPANVKLSASLTAFTANPPFIINLLAQDTDAKILANPRIRVKNREKAKVHIGSRVPVVTTTSTANVGVSSSVSYLDVGLKLDVEPNIYLRDEVAIKIGLEVSSITRTLDLSGTRAYELGTRNTATVLQIKDGETQVLAGLINDEDRRSANKIPGLGDFPVLGRLFRDQTDDLRKTEIILLITPRVVRNLIWASGTTSDLAVGTDAFIGMPPLKISPTTPGALALAPAPGFSGGSNYRPPTPQGSLPSAVPQPLPGSGTPQPQVAQPGNAISAQPAQPGFQTAQPPTASAVSPNNAAPAVAMPQSDPSAMTSSDPTITDTGTGSLLMAAPLAARGGNEVLLSLGLPPGTPAVSARLDLTYDPSTVEPVGAAVSAPGRLPIRVDGAVSVRFKVLATQGRAQIRAENVVGQDANGGNTVVLPPAPIDITITQ